MNSFLQRPGRRGSLLASTLAATPVLAKMCTLCERGWQISEGFNFCSALLEEGCALMCSLVGCKKQRVSKYAGGAACGCEDVHALQEGFADKCRL